MNALFRTSLTLAAALVCAQASAQVTFFEHDGFGGRSFTATGQLRDLTRYGFNDRTSSVVVLGDRWEACDDARFGGRCVVLRPGRYPSLSAMGLNNRLSSVRVLGDSMRISDDRYAPYDALVEASPRAAYITAHQPELDTRLRAEFARLAVTYQEASFGDFHVFCGLSRKVTPAQMGWGGS